jgi:hypothetical protein
LAHGTFFHRVKGTKITFQHYIQKVHTKIQQLPLLTHQLSQVPTAGFKIQKQNLICQKSTSVSHCSAHAPLSQQEEELQAYKCCSQVPIAGFRVEADIDLYKPTSVYYSYYCSS